MSAPGSQAAAASSSSSPETTKPKPPASRACIRCRNRKTRCQNNDGVTPCAYCVSIGKECAYEAPKRTPPTTYAQSLENRIEAMEGLLRRLSTNSGVDLVALLDNPEPETSDERSAMMEQVAQSMQRQAAPVASAEPPPPPKSTNDLVMDDDADDIDVDNFRYLGRSAGPYLARNLLRSNGAPDTVNINMSSSLVESMLESELQRTTTSDLPFPPTDLTCRLINAFFEHWNDTQWPLLHRPSFDRAISAGMVDTNPSFKNLVWMILALGARWVDDPRLLEASFPVGSSDCPGFAFYRAASGKPSPSSILIPSNLFDIQASVLALVYLMGTMTPIAIWSAVGFAMRKAIDVGVHREARYRWQASPLEDQLRKRAFHTLYSLDRSISAMMGRPVSITDEDIDLEYPLDITDTELDEWNLRGSKSVAPVPNGPSTIATIEWSARLQRIHGQVLKKIYTAAPCCDPTEATQIVSSLDSQLNEWLTMLPPHLKNAEKPNVPYLTASAGLFGAYYYCQILIHRDFISPVRSRLVKFPSLAICNNAARSCAQLLDTVRKHGKTSDTFWWSPLCTGTASLILLVTLLAHGTKASLTSSAIGDIHKCLLALEALQSNTHMARKCLRGIHRLIQLADLASNMDLVSRIPALQSEALRDNTIGPDALDNRSATSSLSPATPPSGARTLPFTTDDLSLRTFNGDMTFSPYRPPVPSEGLSGLTPRANNSVATPDFSWDPYENFVLPEIDRDDMFVTSLTGIELDAEGRWKLADV